MFNFPAQSANVCRPGNYPKTVEQRCTECTQWFFLRPFEVKAAMDVWSAPPADGVGYPFQHCSCAHCGKAQILVMVGKYDPPFARARSRCSVQFWTWSSDKLAPKGARP